MTLAERRTCAQCGAPLEVPEGKTPRVTFVGSSGSPNERVLHVGGTEIHRCVSGDRADAKETC